MKYKYYLFSIISALVTLCVSCTKKTNLQNSNRVYFTIDSVRRHIEIPVHLSNGAIANLTFDSGASDGRLILDSTFLASYPDFTFNVIPYTYPAGSAWSANRALSRWYNISQTIRIGNTELEYSAVSVTNWRAAIFDNYTDGLFNVPLNDTHIWELNFEYYYLEIHSAENFQMPKNAFIVPLERRGVSEFGTFSNSFFIQLPMQVKCPEGYNMVLNNTYMIDTGMPWDIVLRETDDIFFNRRTDAVWTKYLDGHYRHYLVEAILFEDFHIDSLRLYKFSPFPVNKNLIGINFLKRFNVFFDMKNQQLGLQPIENFQRVVCPLARRFHFSFSLNQEGGRVVSMIANYDGNPYIEAGLQVGDEIVALNGIIFRSLTLEQWTYLQKRDTWVLDIIRNGQPMQLTVCLKNVVHGD